MGTSGQEGPKDPVRIDVSDVEEVAHWSRVLGCSDAELRAAVAAAGPLAERVRHWLTRQKPPANDPSA
jgi:hypothetical protein